MENTEEVVNEELTTPQPSEGEETQVIEEGTEEIEETNAPGSKTDSVLLLESLKKEKEKRRILEEEKKRLEEEILNTSTSNEDYSDEGLVLKKKIDALEAKLSNIDNESLKSKLLMQYPELAESELSFNDYLNDPENKGMKLETAAKAFMAENGLLKPKRKGLEKPTGGDKTPQPKGMSGKDVENLRRNNFRKYQELLVKGELKIAE